MTGAVADPSHARERPPVPSAPLPTGTIYDVARIAGVSAQSVSRYMRGLSMRAATKDKIAAALSTVRYRPNLAARALTTGRSHRIGVLTHELDQVGPGQIVRAASTAARKAGYLLDIVALDMSDREAIDDALRLLIQHDLAGIIALASTDDMRECLERASVDVPFVLATEEDDALSDHPSEVSAVGYPALIGHLAELGHRTFLHVAGPIIWSAARNRIHAYEEALQRNGLQSAGVLHGDWSARSGYDAVAALGADLPATAIVCANDQMALGVVRNLRDRGLDVPADVSVTGVDDIPEAAYFSPSLTTLRVDFSAQGTDLVRQLLASLGEIEHVSPDTQRARLVVRGSTGPARTPGGE